MFADLDLGSLLQSLDQTKLPSTPPPLALPVRDSSDDEDSNDEGAEEPGAEDS
jgi:hypothetical protein